MPHLQADDPDPPWAGEEEEEVRCPHQPPEGLRHGQQGEAVEDLEQAVLERNRPDASHAHYQDVPAVPGSHWQTLFFC